MAEDFLKFSAPTKADPVRRARIDAHKRAIRSAMALADLREALGVTQQQMAAAMEESQANISRIEHQENVYFSTLAQYIMALGGQLQVTAVFPEQSLRLTQGGGWEPVGDAVAVAPA